MNQKSTLWKSVLQIWKQLQGTVEVYLTNHHSPFIEDILAELLPEKLKVPELTGYDGKEDLLSNLNKYTS